VGARDRPRGGSACLSMRYHSSHATLAAMSAMPAANPAAYERFYPPAPEPRDEFFARGLESLRRLAHSRITGMAELREYASQPGVNLESLLHFLRRIESELRRQIQDDIKQVKVRRSEFKVMKRSPHVSRTERDLLGEGLETLEEIAKIDQQVLDSVRASRHHVEDLRSARLREYAEEWAAYLDQLASDPSSAPIAEVVKRFWQWISQKLWAPEAAPMDDSFLLTWDRDDHRLQVVIDADSTFGWSYYNQQSEELIMEEGQNTGRYSQDFKAAISRMTG
jgi:hypothetical protein